MSGNTPPQAPFKPSPLPNQLQFTIGSTNYVLPLVPGSGVRVVPKPQRGQLYATYGTLSPETRLDAPWVVADLKGIGVARTGVLGTVQEADERAWEMASIIRWPGMWCLAPKAQSATDIAGVHNIVGFVEAIGVLFYYASTNAAQRETLAYWVGSTATWTSCTATVDWEAIAAGFSGFPCAGVAEFQGGGVANLSAVALRTVAATNAGAFYQLMYSADKTTWTALNHAAAADTPAGNTTDACTGLVHILGTLYTLSYNSTTGVITLRQSTNGTTWTTATGGTLRSIVAPRALVMQFDYAGTPRPFVYTQEGSFYYTGTAFGMALDYRGDLTSTNGRTPIQWPVDAVPGAWNVSQQGRNIITQGWVGNGVASLPTAANIAPTDKTHGLPSNRNGLVTALAAARNFLWAAIGGDSASTVAGIFQRSDQAHPLGWQGPLYVAPNTNLQIRALWYSSLDDGIPRLHWVEDNGTAGDVDPKFMANITRDPRTVSGYAHTASGSLVLPKNSRGLPDLDAIWYRVRVLGTGLSVSNNVSAVYARPDGTVFATADTWATTLGSITTNGGTVSFAATPAGTGQSAKEMQVRLDLAGVSDASPYIEAVVIEVAKYLPVKNIRIFEIDMTEPVGTQAGLSSQDKLARVAILRDAATYAQVSYGEESNLVMKMSKDSAEYMKYTNYLLRTGTGGSVTRINTLELALEDV